MRVSILNLSKDVYSTIYKFILDSVDDVTSLNMNIETCQHQDDCSFDLDFNLRGNLLKIELLDDCMNIKNISTVCKIPSTEFSAIQIF